MRSILLTVVISCTLSIASVGCHSDDEESEKGSASNGATSDDNTVRGTGNTSDNGSSSDEEPDEVASDNGNGTTKDSTRTEYDDAGDTTDTVAQDSDAGDYDEPTNSNASTDDSCAELAACCDSLSESTRTDCEDIVELGFDNVCESRKSIYCDEADGGIISDNIDYCDELSICCDEQTDPMLSNICNMTASSNNSEMCRFMLTADLPGGVTCDYTPVDDNNGNNGGNGGIDDPCDALSVCCDQQTNPIIEIMCEGAVIANINANCIFLLTFDLPGSVPCDPT